MEEFIKQTITNKYSRHHYCEGIENLVSIPDELDRRKVDKIIIAQDSVNVIIFDTQLIIWNWTKLLIIHFQVWILPLHIKVAITSTMITSLFCFLS